MIDICSPRFAQYMGVFFNDVRGDFRVVGYRAKNCMGLIGSECNGIAILDERNKCVVLDEHMRQPSGYCIEDYTQRTIEEEARRLLEMAGTKTNEFKEFCGSHPRSRKTTG